jgi:hypothetical protein
MSGLQKRLKAASSAFMSMGTGMVISGLARLAPMIGAVGTLQDLGKMKDAADALNMTGEAASGLFGVLAANGGDFKEDLEGIVQFSGRIREALAGVGGSEGQAAQLFKGLSVSAKELEGVPLDEQFYRVLGAIRELPQEQQAFKLGLVGGTDSMKKWLPLLARSADETRRMAKSLGMTDEQLTEARDSTRAYQVATASLTAVWRQAAVAVAPVIQMTAEWVTKTIGPLAQLVQQNRAAVIAFVATSAATVALGAAFIGLGLAINAGLAVLSGLGVALTFLASPLGVAVAAVAALAAGFVYLTGVGSALGDTMRGVKDALQVGDLSLAWQIGAAGMALEWAKLVGNLTKVWNDFKSFFVDGWHDAVYLVRQMWSELVTFVAQKMVQAGAAVARNLPAGTMRMMGATGAALQMMAQDEGVVLEGIRKRGEAERLELHKTFQAEQAAREAARRGDAEGAAAAVAAAEAARRQLLVTAAFRRAFGGGGGAGAGAGGGTPDPTAAMGAVRGMFAGFGNLAQSLGGGGPTREVTKRLDKVIEKTDEEIRVMEDVAAALGNIHDGGFVWGV